MEVFYDHQDWLGSSQSKDELGQGVEQAPLLLFRLQRGGRRETRKAHGKVGKQPTQFSCGAAQNGPKLLSRHASHVRLQQVNEWRIGERGIWLEALALEAKEPHLFSARSRFGNQPRLADAGVTSDQDRQALAAANVRESALDRLKFAAAANDDRADERLVPRHYHRCTGRYPCEAGVSYLSKSEEPIRSPRSHEDTKAV
jgi:hypothetical protein